MYFNTNWGGTLRWRSLRKPAEGFHPPQDLLDELPFLLTDVIALLPSANVRQQFGPKRLQFLEDPLDDVSLSGEQRLGTPGVHAIERRLVERGWLHDTPRSELVDHHLNETDLRRGQASVGEEPREGLLRGSAVHPHQAPHEMGQ